MNSCTGSTEPAVPDICRYSTQTVKFFSEQPIILKTRQSEMYLRQPVIPPAPKFCSSKNTHFTRSLFALHNFVFLNVHKGRIRRPLASQWGRQYIYNVLNVLKVIQNSTDCLMSAWMTSDVPCPTGTRPNSTGSSVYFQNSGAVFTVQQAFERSRFWNNGTMSLFSEVTELLRSATRQHLFGEHAALPSSSVRECEHQCDLCTETGVLA